MTSLRQRALDELQRRNYSPAPARGYILAISQFAEYFGKSKERLGGKDIRQFGTYLLRRCPSSNAVVAAALSACKERR